MKNHCLPPFPTQHTLRPDPVGGRSCRKGREGKPPWVPGAANKCQPRHRRAAPAAAHETNALPAYLPACLPAMPDGRSCALNVERHGTGSDY